jgi:hypothetical protein
MYDYIKKNFITYTLQRILLWWPNHKEQLDGAGNTDCEDMKCMKYFSRKGKYILGKIHKWEDLND